MTAQSSLFADAAPAEAPAGRERPSGPYQSILVNFEDLDAIPEFARLVGQPVTAGTRWISFPPRHDYEAWKSQSAPRPVDDDDEAAEVGGDRGEQVGLFGDGPWWKDLWRGMPEFDQRDLLARHSVRVDFPTAEDVAAFSRLVDQPITPMARRTRSIWYPEAEIGRFADKRYRSREPRHPRFPIYIVSKGRWESRLTSKALHRLGVRHFMVVEEQEVEKYAAAIGPLAELVVLDPAYKARYGVCDDLGLTKGPGPGPARNFAWEHSIRAGFPWHWVMDDNIEGFYRLNRNLKTPVADGTIIAAMEDYVLRFSNVGMAGPNYFMFMPRKAACPPFHLNTRIYSCNLIRNDLPFRWRGRYNEDTDLSVRILRDGLSTIQFNAFLQFKTTTQTMGGGNTAEFYAHEGTLPKSRMQVALHPDISRIMWRFGRWHHYCDFRGFRKNLPTLREGVTIADGVDDMGMYLEVDPPTPGGSR